MAKRKRASAKTVPPKLKGKSFYLDPKIHPNRAIDFRERIRVEGGTVAKATSPALSYLLLDPSRAKTGRSRPERAVAKLVAGGASIEVVDLDEFLWLVLPTPAEALVMLAGGEKERERLLEGQPRWAEDLELLFSDVDLRGVDFMELWLVRTSFRNVDLRGANLRNTWMLNLSDCRLDGADLSWSHWTTVKDSVFDGMVIEGLYCERAERCSFRDSKLSWSRLAGGTQFVKCDFTKADLSGSTLGATRFEDCDLSRAKLVGAEYEEAEFVATKFVGADLSKATLTKATFEGCDLRRANFRGANLVGADLRGANIRNANFTDAVLREANLDGLDRTLAKGLVDAVTPKGPGPNLLDVERLAKQRSPLLLTFAFERQGKSRMDLQVEATKRGNEIGINKLDPKGLHWGWRFVLFDTVRDALVDLVAPHLDETLLFRSIRMSAAGRESPKLGRLAIGALCEVMQRPIPTDDELDRMLAEELERTRERQGKLVRRLKKGRKEIDTWNERPPSEWMLVDLVEIDLSGLDLTGINLALLTGEGANFEGATLTGSLLSHGRFRGANFAGADLRKARMQDIDLQGANLEGSNWREASAQLVNLRDANLRGADLRGADLNQALLGGADLSDALLDKRMFSFGKYNSKTLFPKGFQPPSSLRKC